MRGRHVHHRRLRHPAPPDPAKDARIAVFAPSPILSVTIESGIERPEVHLHPAGQGYWVARMAAELGAAVILCCAVGGEPGQVLLGLLSSEAFTTRTVDARTPNGVYVHDRRSGARTEIVRVDSHSLTRHAVDELYSVTLGAALDADITLVTGVQPVDLLDAAHYRRLLNDLRANGKTVLADLTGPPLQAALLGGIDLLKLSSEELIADRLADSDALTEVVPAIERLHERGARCVLISRGGAPALLLDESDPSRLLELTAPVFEAIDHRGAGDSMFAATGVGLARGLRTRDAARLGMAAGALNVTRRGLGTGTRHEIERLADHVTIEPLLDLQPRRVT